MLQLPSLAVLLTVFILLGCARHANDSWSEARNRMVRTQIEARGIRSKEVLGAMRAVPRHLFIPERNRRYAYDDCPVPIGEGQTISQPYIVALMTDELRLTGDESVLEVGTGLGYQATVLAEIVDTVYTIEIVPSLAAGARANFNSLGYTNIFSKCGDGYEGWPEYAPFDRVIVTCAPDHVPQPLVEQLAEGGLMVIPVGRFGSQELYVVEKRGGEIHKRAVIPVSFVPLTGPHGGPDR